MQWMPIATAPKNGTDVLCWCDFEGVKIAVVLSWEVGEDGDGAWWDWDLNAIDASVPTHWMPLPEAPA